MSGGRLTLPERCGRVEHDRDRRRFAAPGHDVDQKVLPVSCNGVIDAPRPGRHANLVLFNASDYREIVHPFGINQVHMVIVRGVTVYQEGRVRRNLADPTPP